MLKQFLDDESGATAIEYVLIAAIISVVIIVGAKFLEQSINSSFEDTADKIGSAEAG